jgi:hypothetical protein
MSAKPLPEDVFINNAFHRAAIAIRTNDREAAFDLVNDLHLLEGKVFLTIVPGAREREARAAAAGFVGRPIDSRFPGTCEVCRKPFGIGAPILYNADLRRAAHHACGGVE